VAELEREKYAVTARQRVARKSPPELADEQLRRREPEPKPEAEAEAEAEPEPEPEPQPQPQPQPKQPRRRGRHIPATIRRAVFERDAGRCTYSSDSGERCRETRCSSYITR
jgi:hypothetical protein